MSRREKMERIFRRFSIWYECSKGLKKAEQQEQPQVIADLLRRYPHFVEKVRDRCLGHFKNMAEWYGLIYCTALVLEGCEAARSVVQPLIRLKTDHRGDRSVRIPWSKLTDSQVRSFINYLDRFAALWDILRFLILLDANQLRAVRPAETDRGFLLWFTAAARRGLLTLDDYRMLLGLARKDSDGVSMRVAGWVAGGLVHFNHNDLTRAADLLRHQGSSQWMPYLKSKWFTVEDEVRRIHKSAFHYQEDLNWDENMPLQLAAGAVLAAMGRCAARLPDLVNFERDKQLAQGLAEGIEEHNRLIKEYKESVARYRGDALDESGEVISVTDQNLIEELRELNKRIELGESNIQSVRSTNRSHHSVPFLLSTVINDAQSYPTVVRQGAAWGLHFTLAAGSLEVRTRDAIQESIRRAANAEDDSDFRERRIQFAKDPSFGELVTIVRDGLNWMMDVLGSDYRPDHPVPREEFPDLDHILGLACELIPGAVSFLTTHPLRLMILDDHQHLLGKYVRNGCGIHLWFRYTPPIRVGQVEARWVELLNRGTPNSMGLYYRLFHHAALIVPVIYHEYLHYAGPENMPGRGITNETEVLIREVSFARGLLARLSEGHGDGHAFQKSLLQAVRATNMQGEVLRWLTDFSDDAQLERVNCAIVATYGRQLSDQEAHQRARNLMMRENANIQLANDIEAAVWSPEVRWSPLVEHKPPGARFMALLVQRWRCRHTVTPQERALILNEPLIQQWDRQWQTFRSRCDKGDTLNQEAKQLTQSTTDVAKVIVRPIAFEPVEVQLLQALELRVRTEIAALSEYVEGLTRLTQCLDEYTEELRTRIGSEMDAVFTYVDALCVQHYDPLIKACRDEGDLVLANDMQLRRDYVGRRFKEIYKHRNAPDPSPTSSSACRHEECSSPALKQALVKLTERDVAALSQRREQHRCTPLGQAKDETIKEGIQLCRWNDLEFLLFNRLPNDDPPKEAVAVGDQQRRMNELKQESLGYRDWLGAEGQ